MTRVASAICVAAMLATASAHADGPMPEPPRDVVVRIVQSRSHANANALAAAAFGGLAMIAVAIPYNLSADSDAAKASQSTPNSNRTWLGAEQTAYDDAHRESRDAELLYGAGALLIVGSIAGYFITAPPEHDVVIHPGRAPAAAAIVPVAHGAIAGATWRF